MEVKGPKDNPKKQYVEFADNSDEWDEALDKEVMAALLKNYAEQVDASQLLTSTRPSTASSKATIRNMWIISTTSL